MTYNQILEYIDKNCFTKTKNRICVSEDKIPDNIITYINHFNNLFINPTFIQKIYNFENCISKPLLCENCGLPRKFINYKQGYSKSCGSKSCATKLSFEKMLTTRNKNIKNIKNYSNNVLDITKENLKKWINENLYKSNNTLNGNKTNELKSFYNNNIEYFNTIKLYSNLLENVSWQERINIVLNNIDQKTLIKSTPKNKEELIEWIDSNLLDKNGNFDGNKTANNKNFFKENKSIFDLIDIYVNHLDKDTNLIEKIYCLKNDINHIQKCQNIHCSNDVKFNGLSYNKYCSFECSRNEQTYEIFKQTCLKKYGVDNVRKSKDIMSKYINQRIIKQKTTFKENYYNNIINLYTESNYKPLIDKDLFIAGDFEVKFKCLKCDNIYNEINWTYNGGIHQCKNCNPNKKETTQLKIFNIIKEYDDELLYNDRQLLNDGKYGKELDILSLKYNFAIEYNGLMWHSFGKDKSSKFNNYQLEVFNKNNHLSKTNICSDKGIQLFHIYETEWHKQQNIWLSLIKNKMNLSNKIYARKCIIKEVSNKEASQFLESNHLQGSINSKINLGLYYEENLVSLMTFGQSRYNKNIEWELLRFCNILNHTVIGGASKLLKYFENKFNPKSLISYANKRWSNGNLYYALDFIFLNDSKPNYFYFDTNTGILESRIKYQKHKLKNILQNFNEDLNESENMFNNGYRKIYDSGNKIFIKIYK